MGQYFSKLFYGEQDQFDAVDVDDGDIPDNTKADNIYPIFIKDLYPDITDEKYPSTGSISDLAERLYNNMTTNNYLINGQVISKTVCYLVAGYNSRNRVVDIAGLNRVSGAVYGTFMSDIRLYQQVYAENPQFYARVRLKKTDIVEYITNDVVLVKSHAQKEYVLEASSDGDETKEDAENEFVYCYLVPQVQFTFTRQGKKLSFDSITSLFEFSMQLVSSTIKEMIVSMSK